MLVTALAVGVTVLQLLGRGFAHVDHLDREVQGLARQGMVGVGHHLVVAALEATFVRLPIEFDETVGATTA